ncbi:MAG: helix-turn-helix domain-containing protein [Xanthomonadales bacterium]|nr:helix-turn-helix domain-containing protein [Xanthomonadales bacterium]
MPNIASVLKDEITRLCKKEIRSQIEPIKSASSNYRRDIAELKRRIAELERQNGHLRKNIPEATSEPTEEDRPLRFVAKGLVSLRKRIGLSIEDFAKLLDVSPQSIYNWQAGKTVPRRAQLEKLASIRSIGKREAQSILEVGK